MAIAVGQDAAPQSSNPFAFSRPAPPRALQGGIIPPQIGPRGGVALDTDDAGPEPPSSPTAAALATDDPSELRRLLSQSVEREAYLNSRLKHLEARLAAVDDEWREELWRKTQEADRLRSRCNDLALSLVMNSNPSNGGAGGGRSNAGGDLALPLHLLSISDPPPDDGCRQQCNCCTEVSDLRQSLRESRRALRAARAAAQGLQFNLAMGSPTAGQRGPSVAPEGAGSPAAAARAAGAGSAPGSPQLGWLKRGRGAGAPQSPPPEGCISPKAAACAQELIVLGELLPGMKRLRLQSDGDEEQQPQRATPPPGGLFGPTGGRADASPVGAWRQPQRRTAAAADP